MKNPEFQKILTEVKWKHYARSLGGGYHLVTAATQGAPGTVVTLKPGVGQGHIRCVGGCNSTLTVQGFPYLQVFDANGNFPNWVCTFCKNKGFPFKDCSFYGIRLDANGDLEEIYCHDCQTVHWEATSVMGVSMGPAATVTPPGGLPTAGMQPPSASQQIPNPYHGAQGVGVPPPSAGPMMSPPLQGVTAPNGAKGPIRINVPVAVTPSLSVPKGFKLIPSDKLVEEMKKHGFTTKPMPKLGLCTKCGRELSSTMDAYYGKDPEMAKRCSSCR